MTTIRQRTSRALVGRREAAEILGVKSSNLVRDYPDLPPPLQERGIAGFAVGATPLWPRAEIEDLLKARGRRNDQARRNNGSG